MGPIQDRAKPRNPLPIGSIIVPFCGLYLHLYVGSYKVVDRGVRPKTNYPRPPGTYYIGP